MLEKSVMDWSRLILVCVVTEKLAERKQRQRKIERRRDRRKRILMGFCQQREGWKVLDRV